MSRLASAQEAVEALILEKFQREPFHNLYLLHDHPLTTTGLGGTCSDKTLSFYRDLKNLGITATLHSAFIGGAEIHRLVRVEIETRSFFADVGNGWPSIRMFPIDQQTVFSCYGMRFRSVIHGKSMTILNMRRGVERVQTEIFFDCKSEEAILSDIDARFDRGTEYPFSRSLRFSQVIGDRFLFLRGDRLEIYSSSEPYREITGLDVAEPGHVIREHFGFDVGKLNPE